MLLDEPTVGPPAGDGDAPDTGPEPPRAGQRLAIAAIASGAAAVLHAAASGIHADHPALSRVFVAVAIAQGAAAVLGFVRDDRLAAQALVWVNLVAVAGWVTTRLTGIEWLDGLEVAERPQLADTITALLAAVAVAAAVAAMSPGASPVSRRGVGNAALLAGVLLVPGLADATSHDHAGHADAADAIATDGHAHADAVVPAGADTAGAHAPGAVAADGHAHATTDGAAAVAPNGDIDAALGDLLAPQLETAATQAWPRPWNPDSDPIDFSGVEGVTPEQQARAEQLVRDTLRELQAFSDVSRLGEFGYQSIGDAVTGFEHFVNYGLINDDVWLDPTQPESLVFQVDGDRRTLVSAMFIAGNRAVDDPELVDFGGPLMQWHVHDNLCWGLDENNEPKVVAVIEQPGESCPPASINAGAENPMVHVWIAPHECGPFAALEGHGAGQVDPTSDGRVDQCDHAHTTTGAASTTQLADGRTAAPRPYDPSAPIDLSGTPGVTAEQQAFAENLVAATIRDLPQWADLEVVEAAGFRSIGDAATGHEHYINWEWIDDDVWLDPDYPESLVFAPGPDGTKQLVSAMYMLPSDYTLDDVPDFGGELMQWHIHADLCFTAGPDPQVRGIKPIGGTCRAPLVDGTEAPMIHVWITENECGPFAALEGVGGGQVKPGETVLCDHAHGSTG